jgi:vacuolar-type H+-ATPase subunit H
MASRVSDGAGGVSALARLLSREAELEAQLRAARDRAEGLIRDAEATARARLDRLEADQAAAVAAAEREQADQSAARIAALAHDGARAVARLRAIPADRIAALRDWVVQQILGGTIGTGGAQ